MLPLAGRFRSIQRAASTPHCFSLLLPQTRFISTGWHAESKEKWDPYAEDRPHESQVGFSDEFGPEANEARDAALKQMWEDSFFASAKGIKRADESLKPNEVLLFQTTRTNKMRLALTSGVVPVGYGALLLIGRLASLFPVEYVPSYAQIALWLAGGSILVSVTGQIANFTIREMILTDSGKAVRLRTFRSFSGYGPSVTVPIKALSEHIPDSVDAYRYLRIQQDAPMMMLYTKGDIPQPAALERVLAGLPVSLQQLGTPPEDVSGWAEKSADVPPAQTAQGGAEIQSDLPAAEEADLAHWRVAQDNSGRKYYWHAVTRETRWTKPGLTMGPQETPTSQ